MSNTSLKTCPNCGGLFDISGACYSGRPCNCGYAQTVDIATTLQNNKIEELTIKLSTSLELLEKAKDWLIEEIEKQSVNATVMKIASGELNRISGEDFSRLDFVTTLVARMKETLTLIETFLKENGR